MMEEGASLPVAEWLRALHLDQYLESFEKNDLWKVSDCRNLTDEALTRIGIVLPGHRKRILLGLQKAFMESPLATEGPVVAARRPVPMKRNIFRVSADAVTTQAEPELKGDSVTPASRKSPLLTELENPAGLSQVPPPIPPRLGCRPPVKFSSASSPVSAELSPTVPCRSEPPPFTDFAPPLPAPLPARDKLSLGPAVPEGKGKPPLPPLPMKRHQLETKPLSLKVPPLPSRPPLLPPRALSQRTATR
ncbi:arf-GAP with Rho-GAP domain, ANK repeat and PH domain-containing protein 1-like [Trachemys scripta elegans]|uniref:arf-GAP with Rho-GAP domain, ANK repeat and PH domain-containing protein 1-like n=1 Tax=Trachemys scripta elegans TaxID=31138 RepID=UPI0015582B27|nr:arf-GAP with Rho-GAP domain, ANK repeat and PH domain-containing protein 1-like [Trachemys scripta elegans]XP_034615109.1 arf-GAP with Rho-GAP domain, ANK repeat and PH domain-containing protein 1-like [Trachemys scripta elegans]XP_034615110.1 arf-GAP with Rho-GAP domain, ANK repeat and PH domain-containing protein 1-like [Trachemys scripta elegans]